jgi:hypothetical protein
MANGHGGQRRPSNPAPVSGPGALSRRTDGQGPKYISGGQYGEGQEMMDLQASAPMSETKTRAPRMSAGKTATAPPPAQVTPLFAPTQRPDEPITAGAPFGPGPGPQTPSRSGKSLTATLEKLLPYDSSGQIARLYQMAASKGW